MLKGIFHTVFEYTYVNSKSFFHVNPNSIILAMTKILIVNVWEIPIISRFNDTLL